MQPLNWKMGFFWIVWFGGQIAFLLHTLGYVYVVVVTRYFVDPSSSLLSSSVDNTYYSLPSKVHKVPHQPKLCASETLQVVCQAKITPTFVSVCLFVVITYGILGLRLFNPNHSTEMVNSKLMYSMSKFFNQRTIQIGFTIACKRLYLVVGCLL
jgi:hypothetical protein